MTCKRLMPAIFAAALLWFYMFSPWTAGLTDFWLTMACAAVILTVSAVALTPKGERGNLLAIKKPLLQGAAF